MPGIVLGAVTYLLVLPGPNVCQSGMEGINFGTTFIHADDECETLNESVFHVNRISEG